MPPTPDTYPVSHGSYAFLKVLSSDGDGPVYLAALSGAKKPWVIKTLPLQGSGAVDPDLAKADAKTLSRMHSAYLATVLASSEVERDGGFVMEYVAGKSLAAIGQRAEEFSLLLPPELGLLVAHDAFSAAEFFHGFQGEHGVHGNISPHTLLVDYSGEVKLAGYRPGARTPSGSGAHAAMDLKPLARILSDLPFERFPKELANLVPRLLEDDLSPVEAAAAVRAFLHDYSPSADQRRKVAGWLADVFIGQREREAREESRLLASGMQMLVPVSVGPPVKRLSVVGSTTALLALVGVGAVVTLHRRPGQAHSETTHQDLPALSASRQAFELRLQAAAPLSPAVVPPVPPTPEDPVVHSGNLAKPTSDTPGSRPSKREPAETPADRLLRASDAAFGAGKRIEAINLGLQAVDAGGGIHAHLALGEYYRSMHRYQEAMNHYRAAVEIEPENKLALAGVKLLEKKLSPCQ